MKFFAILNIFLVSLAITGCKCGSGEELGKSETGVENSSIGDSKTATNLQRKPETQAEVAMDDHTDAERPEEDAEQPKLPLEREGAKKVTKKADLPEYCKINIKADDTPKFNLSSVKIVKSCPRVRIILQNSGEKSREDGGVNFLIVENSKMEDFLEKALVAGSINSYVPRNDGRVVASTTLIGPKKTTQVEFNPKDLVDGVEYIFLCTFPNHSTAMRGKVLVE